MNGTFTDVSVAEGVSDSTRGRGVAMGDYDNDGDLDMVVVCTHEYVSGTDRTLLYRNDISNGKDKDYSTNSNGKNNSNSYSTFKCNECDVETRPKNVTVYYYIKIN